MDHNNDVGVVFKSEPVAGLLISAVAAIARMRMDNRIGQTSGDVDGLVPAGIIDDNDQVHNPLGHNLIVGIAKGPGGIVGRHYDNDFFVVKHWSYYSIR